MTDCFISYRRTPSAPVATTLQAKLESKYGFSVYVDTTRTDGTRVKFPERLMDAITDATVFVCLLGERDGQHTLQSEWVIKEIEQAYDLRKFCIPVFQESYRPLPDMPPAVDYLLGFDGVHYFDQKNVMVDDSVRQIADLIRPHRKQRRIPLLVGLGIVIGMIALGLGLLLARENGGEVTLIPTVTTTAATTEIAQVTTVAPTEAPSQDVNLSAAQELQTIDARRTESAEMQVAFNLTASKVRQLDATETAARSTLLALSWTPTPTATLTPTLSLEQVALTPQTSNSEWLSYITERGFNGVAMMLVPAGSFQMGSTEHEIDFGFAICQEAANEGAECQRNWYEDEAPNGDNAQTFTQPFWIDKTKVSRAQYQDCVDAGACESTQSSEYSTEPNQPINHVTWFQARAFCEWRDSRLLTEAEWEYAARGPDRLIFPWGDEFDGTLANHCDGNCNEAEWASSYDYVNKENDDGYAVISPVSSYPSGASWVGALDMSGNLWEWTTSLYENYPYDADDGREDDMGSSTDVHRVLRGGAFNNTTHDLRAANRNWSTPDLQNGVIGFRCARDFE